MATLQLLDAAQGAVTMSNPVPMSDAAAYPSNVTAVSASSGNVANSAASASLAAVAAKTNYVTAIEITAGGATAAALVVATLTNTLGGTQSFIFGAPAGVAVAATPLLIKFDPPLQATAVNTAITVSLPALGAGNTNAAVCIHGYYL